ncbi:MAG: 2'-5' RNA ligase family protein [Chloroflexi bacterium]|nr:2'-5' RNA ligase family protein [Chloroflexota bacterium]
MPVSFLVEFRLRGYAREYAEWARERTLAKAQELGVKRVRQPRFVPHITLFGEAETHNLRNVIREVERIGRKYTLVPFKIGVKRGEFQKEDANWLYVDVHPSPGLEQFRRELAQSLCRLDNMISRSCKSYDHDHRYKFHCSITKYAASDNDKFEKLSDCAETKLSIDAFKRHKASAFGKLFNIIKKYISIDDEDDLGINQNLLRVTVLGRGSRIQAEYDLMLKRLLNRRQALDRLWSRITVAKLRILLGRAQNVFFISDTHFDHENIIGYCHRSFSSTKQMNRTMKKNWNSVVGGKDSVYFLGDWSFRRKARYWMRQLNGYIFPIRGSHDRDEFSREFCTSELLHSNGRTFLLIHDPGDEEAIQNIKERYDWIIHGHVHNNKMDRYPFINGEKKTINVSVELTDYRPVSLSYLLSLNLDSIKRMRTIDSQPERW